MCGRVVLSSPPAVIAARFFLDLVPELEARYNISPGQDLACVVPNPTSAGSVLRMLNWGLTLPWEKGPDHGPKLINARSETVAEKPAFKDAFTRRRCLIPVDGFFEWQKRAGGSQPYYFSQKDQPPRGDRSFQMRMQFDPTGRVHRARTTLWFRAFFPFSRRIR